jgi:hypothetical protein
MSVVAEGLANLVDALHQTVVGNSRAAPDRFQQFSLGDQSVRVLDEMTEDRKGSWPERDCIAAAKAERFRIKVDDHPVTKDEGGSCW